MTTSITSDRDYLEILTDGDTTISTGGVSDTDAELFSSAFAGSAYGLATVTHGLGSVPLVRAYFDPAKNGTLYSTPKLTGTSYQSFDDPWLTTVTTTTTTKLFINSNTSATSIPVYYRIYRFGTKSVTSDERIDKIFMSGSSSATLSAAANSNTPQHTVETIPHGQGEAVLSTLELSPDGVTWYGQPGYLNGGFDTTSGPPGGPYVRYFYIAAIGYADATNFYIWYEHNYATSKTIYVRYALDLKA